MYCEKCGKYSGRYPLCKECYYAEEAEETIEEKEDENLTCPICGEPTSVYYGNARKDKLCQTHAKMLKSELIEINEKGLYISKATKKILNKDYNKDTQEENQQINTQNQNAEEIQIEDTSELSCIICGENSNGKHFCYHCYKKYKDKVVLLKVHKCEFPTGEPLDESYEGVYECQDGHIVKSIAEQTIDNELFAKGIFHAYEAPLDVDEDKPLKPDFCLKNYLGEGNDVYIEYFGLKGQPKYDEHTEYKMKHYRKKGITLVCLYPKDSKNLQFALQTKVFNKGKIKINAINNEEK